MPTFYISLTVWNNLPYETNKVRNLGHELRDEFKSVFDRSNCYHMLADDIHDESKLYFITFHTCGPKWCPFTFQAYCALFYRAGLPDRAYCARDNSTVLHIWLNLSAS